MQKRWTELFQGLMKGDIPFDNEGYILSARFDDTSNYAIIEVIGFQNVKNIAQTPGGVTFHSDGYKIYIMYEPVTYQYRFQEPYLRDAHAQIPLRFNELDVIELPRHDKIFISKEPFVSHGSFNVEKPSSGNFVYYFYHSERIDDNLVYFIQNVMSEDLRVPKSILRELEKYLHKNLTVFHTSLESDQ